MTTPDKFVTYDMVTALRNALTQTGSEEPTWTSCYLALVAALKASPDQQGPPA